MKKALVLLLSVVLVINIFAACGSTLNSSDDISTSGEIVVDNDIQAVEDDEPIKKEVESESIEESLEIAEDEEWNGTYNVMPEPFGNTSGGEHYQFYSTTNIKIGAIDVEFYNLEYIGWDVFKEWLHSHSSKNSDYTSISEAANLYSMIKYFDIPEETVREILAKVRTGREDELSEDEIKMLFSDDYEAVAECFASDTAIRKEDNLYSLYWVYEHSIEDYIEAGITTDDISGVLAAYDEVGLTSAAKSAITAKLNDYINGNYEVAE
ncbi:MAG: hypothetical protein LUH23_09560 [Oscillospiraceae bacterium]|nr:hypothetical protein [Oscillospiraceae bacterium]